MNDKAALDPVALARELIRFNTVNPPGQEQACAEHLGRILEAAGFDIQYQPLAPGRPNLIARIGGSPDKPPLCLSGHTDTVPLGNKPWSFDPFCGELSDGRLLGRGSSDMKGGVAAIIAAAVDLADQLHDTPGLVLVITAGEEHCCEGAKSLARNPAVLGSAGAMVIAEPTGNRPLVGHKGVFWFNAHAHGVTAHASMPDQGKNAIYDAARAISRLEQFHFGVEPHPVLGPPTLNVGWIKGGININSVPDEALFGVDIRLIPGIDIAHLKASLQAALGPDMDMETVDEEAPVWTDPDNAWIQEVFAVVNEVTGTPPEVAGAPYFTDASALSAAYGGPPAVILGPGEAEQAHQTDEFCYTRKIEEATAIFTGIARKWCGV